MFHKSVAEDAGGLAPAKDDNADLWEIGRRRVSVFEFVDDRDCVVVQAISDRKGIITFVWGF